MSVFDDDEEQRSRSFADALSTSMMRSVCPLLPAWSGQQPGNADLITQALAEDAVGSPPHCPAFGYGTDIATPVAQDLFTEMLRRVKESDS